MKRPVAIGVASLLATALLAPARSWGHGSHDERIAAQSRLIAAAPRDAQLYLDRAAVHLDRSDWAAATADLDAAGELDPSLAAVHSLRGLLLWRRGWNREAESALSRFLAAEPASAEGFAARARVRADLGRPLDAARDFSRAIAQRPAAGPDLYLERAQALDEAGDAHLEEALAGLEEGIAWNGPLPTLALEAVEIEVRLGRLQDAAQRLDAATRSFPVRAPWLVRIGEILESADQPDAACHAFRSALDEIAALPAHRRQLLTFAALHARALDGIARTERR